MWKKILKGEEIHPSVKGHQKEAMYKLRSDLIKMKKQLKKNEEFTKTKEFENLPQWDKDNLLYRMSQLRRDIELFSKQTGASFGAKKGKDPLTGREYDKSIEQRLSPSTKKPKVERMKRPLDEISYDPNEKDMDKILMRRFGLSEEKYKELSPKVKQDLMNVYEMTKD